MEQLACMMEVLGIPTNLVLEHASRKKMFFGMFIKHEFTLLNRVETLINIIIT